MHGSDGVPWSAGGLIQARAAWWLAGIATLALATAAPASGDVIRSFHPYPWVVPRASDGFKPSRITRRIKKVRIEILTPTCGGLDHIAVHRSKRSVVITTVYLVLSSDGYSSIGCMMPTRQLRTVSLRGKLGKRSIRDGSFDPPKVRYHAPR